MNRLLLVTLAVAATAFAASAATLPPVVRGDRAVLLRVEAGALSLKLYKRDLNIYPEADDLRAQLYDPTRRLVATLEIPDDGLAQGKRREDLQVTEVTLPHAVPGVYRLQLTGVGDAVFGLQTNAPGCMIQGDITLNDGTLGGKLLFAPPATKFTLKAEAFHSPGEQQMPLRDAQGQLLRSFDLGKQGVPQTFTVEAGAREGLWRCEIAKMDVKLTLTPAQPWTLDESAWFAVDQTKGMLLPYKAARFLQPGATTTVPFRLRNGTAMEATYQLTVTAEAGVQASVAPPTVTLQANERRDVTVKVTLAPGATTGPRQVVLTGRLAAAPTVVASAGLELRPGVAPAGQALTLPIVLRPYEHENWQFGYAPDYAPNEVYFDRHNRPYIRQRGESDTVSTGLQVLEGGRWILRPFTAAIQQVFPDYREVAYGAGGFLGAKIAFDGEDGAYTLLRLSLQTPQLVLVYTPDAGKSYQVYPIPGGAFDLEQFTGHNALNTPPPILSYVFVKPHPAEFAAYYDLNLILPQKVDGKLVLGAPVKIAENCVGSCQHSGAPASTVTRDGKTHIVWGEIAPDDAPGVPEYVATYDHATGKVSPKVLLGYGPPVNDVHNVPAITQDSRGYLHVVIGSHGQAFQYVRSLRPGDASEWTKPVPVLSAGYVDDKTDADGAGRQTYISLVCDQQDTLHIAFRQWRRNVDQHHPGQIYAALSVQSKPAGGEWSAAQPIVVPPVPGYSIYYHKLTTDRRGRLFLSYSYWTSHVYQEDFPDRYHDNAVVMSEDGGKTWRLLQTPTLAAAVD